MRPTDKIIVRIQQASDRGKGVRLSADEVYELASGVFLEDICISDPGPTPYRYDEEIDEKAP